MSSGVHVGRGSLSWLVPTLKTWCHYVRLYCEAHEGADAPHHHTELGSVGVLQAAAWASGCVALSEFQANKSDGNGGEWRGRGDLYIYNPAANFRATVEAKHTCLTPRTRTDASNFLRVANSDAVNSARYGAPVAAVFFALKVPEGFNLEAVIHVAKTHVFAANPHLVAWSFPASAARKVHRDEAGRPFIWPGTILALKRAQHFPDSSPR